MKYLMFLVMCFSYLFFFCFSLIVQSSVQFNSITQLCLTLCDPILEHTKFPCPHHLLEFAQTQTIKLLIPSKHLISLSPPFSRFKHQGLYQWVDSLHQMAKYWSFSFSIIPSKEIPSIIPSILKGWSPSEWPGWISLQSKGLSRVFSNTTVQKNQFFGAQLFFYCPALPSIQDYWKNHSFDYTDLCRQSNVSAF